jgi:hypothetical protein
MRTVSPLLVALALLLQGCVLDTTSDRDITCGNFDDFLYECTANCTPTWDCELNYDDLDIHTQIALDDCSDCLVDNLMDGVCGDCAVPAEGISSCRWFMEDLLGVSCW